MENNESFNVSALDIAEKRGFLYYSRQFMYKLGGALEILIILAIWALIFSNQYEFGDFTYQGMIAYIIIGNLIGLLTGIFLHRVIATDIDHKNSMILVYRPLRYCKEVLFKGFAKNLLPFFIAVLFHSWLLFYFVDDIDVNYNPLHLAVIILMIILAFIIELLIAYILKLYIFWTLESKDLYRIINWLKKLLAGGFFPLILLPPVIVKASLLLPFAYSFYVPTELYLKKINIIVGIRGIGIQLIWICLLYVFIKVTLDKKQEEKKKAEQSSDHGFNNQAS